VLRCAAAISLFLLIFAAGGCATIRVTDPAHTATEQFLMSQAITAALKQLNVDALRDRKVWLETGYFTGAEQVVVNGEVRQRMFTTPEQAFAAAELRERLLLGGARIVQDKKLADIIVEVRSGGIGIDRLENLIGVPASVLGGGVAGSATSAAQGRTTRNPSLNGIQASSSMGVRSNGHLVDGREATPGTQASARAGIRRGRRQPPNPTKLTNLTAAIRRRHPSRRRCRSCSYRSPRAGSSDARRSPKGNMFPICSITFA